MMYRFEDEKYCVWKLPQDERYCYNCSLGNFGLDRRNNPIHYSDTEEIMYNNLRKLEKA